MTTFATGKKAYAISDRSGQRFPYDEMVTEWNGSFVHYTEYESKQPQLEPKVPGNDPQGLLNAYQLYMPLKSTPSYRVFFNTTVRNIK